MGRRSRVEDLPPDMAGPVRSLQLRKTDWIPFQRLCNNRNIKSEWIYTQKANAVFKPKLEDSIGEMLDDFRPWSLNPLPYNTTDRKLVLTA
jgi:hypothetical protein